MEEVSREEYISVLKEELCFIDKICSEQNLIYFLYYGTLIGAVRHHGLIPWDDDLDIAMPRPDYEKFLEYLKKNDIGKYVIVNNDTDKSIPYLITRLSDTRYHLEFSQGIQHEIGIFIDIYPLDGMGNNKFIANMHGMFCFFLKKLFFVEFQYYYPKGRWFKNILLKILKKILLMPKKSVMKMFLNHACRKYDYLKSKYVNCCLWTDLYIKAIVPRACFDKRLNVTFEGCDAIIPAGYDIILKACYGNYMELPPPEQRFCHHYYKIYKK